jgi:hypothetical protein
MTLTLDIPPELAGLSRAAFIDALGRYDVTPFQYDADEILADAARITALEQTLREAA